MKDLVDRTGLPRQVIHFYIQQGLLPEGQKTGRNMAYYGEAHVERIKLIRQLQNERFLPLKAIRAVLDEQEDAFTPEQRRLLLDVKGRLAPVLGTAPATVPLHEVLLKSGVSKEDATEMEELGLLTTKLQRGKPTIAKDDAWILEMWGEMVRLGFTRALGFAPKDMLLFADTMSDLFQKEVALMKDRIAQLAPDQVAAMVERSVPIINTFMARYHEALMRSFFASLTPEGTAQGETE
jgi:DNA-binding transcriptional MerR regulator